MPTSHPHSHPRSHPRVPLLDLPAQNRDLMPELREAFEGVLASGDYILGGYVDRFEIEFAKWLGVEQAVGVSSGTDALLVAMMALDIGAGDEVILSPFVFFNAAGSIARLGAKPVFVDINPRTLNLDASRIAAAVTPQTKAVLAAHLFGLPADRDPILATAAEHGLKVIEDCHHALGAKYNGQPVGTLGDAAAFDFFPNKNLPAVGNAGAVVARDPEVLRRVQMLRVHGLDPETDYTYPMIGGNFRMGSLQAAMLSVKLPHLDRWNKRRRDLAKRYDQLFEPLPVSTPFEDVHRRHIYNHYTIRVRGGGRDSLRHHLRACGIGTRVYYPTPLHLQPAFAYLEQHEGSLPNAEAAAKELLTLPIYPEMTRESQDAVVEAVRDYFRAE